MQIEKYLAFLPSFLLLSGCATFEIAGEIQSSHMALMKGDPQEALAHFQRAAQSDPNYIAGNPLQQTVWTYVGRAYYTMGKLPDARQETIMCRALGFTASLSPRFRQKLS